MDKNEALLILRENKIEVGMDPRPYPEIVKVLYEQGIIEMSDIPENF